MDCAGVPSGALGRDDGRMRSLRRRPRAVPAIPFPPRRRPDAFPVMAPEGVPGDGLSRQWMRSLRWRAHARFARVGGRAAAITGLNQALTFTRIGRLCPPNAWRISRRKRVVSRSKIAAISRAKRSAGCACSACSPMCFHAYCILFCDYTIACCAICAISILAARRDCTF